ncbi:arabinofuranosyltransferase [Kineococcus terrestris]|uniref:arabinofuranosyltransferase n=1 Tax=Kineococcus terrestris TaxID=2044856 RepID=UPI0034DADD73
MSQLDRPADRVEPGGPPDSARGGARPVPAPGRDAVVRGGFARLTGALALAGVVSLAVSLAVHTAVRRTGLAQLTSFDADPTYAGTALMTAAVVLVVGAALLVGVRSRWWAGTEAVAVVAVSALSTALLAVPLAGTRYYLGGNSVDQLFRTQFLGRLADDWRLADMNYADLPSFYPSGWFWLAGRYAALTGTPAWEAFQTAGIATAAVVPCLALVAWSRLTGPRRGVLAGLATAAAGVYPAQAGPFVDEPYSWCLAAFVPVAAVVAWRGFGDVAPRRRLAAAVAVGVVLGLGAMTYTLYAGFAALLVALACAVRSAAAWRAGQGPAALRGRVAALVVAALVSAVLALLVWAPYVVAVVTGGGGRAAAQHFLPLISAQLPTPMFNPTPWGALLLLGCLWLVWSVRRPGPDADTARPLLGVVVLAYAWYLLSTAALAARTTLLGFRMEAVLVATTAVAGVMGGAALWRWLRTTALPALPALAARRREAQALLVLGGAAVLVVPLQSTPQALSSPITTAYRDYTPEGSNALGESDPEREDAWNDEVLAAVDELGADVVGASPDQLVVLSAKYELFSFRPWRGFQQVTPHYANPLADYDGRREQVLAWAASTSPAELLQRLDAAPFEAPDVFVLRTGEDGWSVDLARDTFPAEPNVAWERAVFDPALFDDPAFEVREAGPFAVVARR